MPLKATDSPHLEVSKPQKILDVAGLVRPKLLHTRRSTVKNHIQQFRKIILHRQIGLVHTWLSGSMFENHLTQPVWILQKEKKHMNTPINVKTHLKKSIGMIKKKQNEVSSMLWRLAERNLELASHLLLRNVSLCDQRQEKTKMTFLLFQPHKNSSVT